MALVIIYAVLSHFDFVAKFTVKNLNKDFTNTERGGHHFMKVFHKIVLFFKGWLPLQSSCHCHCCRDELVWWRPGGGQPRGGEDEKGGRENGRGGKLSYYFNYFILITLLN